MSVDIVLFALGFLLAAAAGALLFTDAVQERSRKEGDDATDRPKRSTLNVAGWSLVLAAFFVLIILFARRISPGDCEGCGASPAMVVLQTPSQAPATPVAPPPADAPIGPGTYRFVEEAADPSA